MIEAPLGGAAFNNEFGRPNLTGYFRTFELEVRAGRPRSVHGYHKPIMIAGGLGNVRREDVQKGDIPAGDAVIVLGGPAMLIGLGGGAASSVASGASRGGPRFRVGATRQRRDGAPLPGSDRSLRRARRRQPDPARSTTSARAACPTRCRSWCTTASRGARFDAARSAQRRARAVAAGDCGATRRRSATCWRSRPSALERVRGAVRARALLRSRCRRRDRRGTLLVDDAQFGDKPIDMPIDVLFGKPPRMTREAARVRGRARRLDDAIDLPRRRCRVLRLPTVADKTFLITIGDRTRRRADGARSDGGTMAGAGRRRAP